MNEPLADRSAVDGGLVWYVSYGSNTHPGRLACYLAGGRPAGGTRTYPGCRDGRAPRRSVALEVPGALYFATESPVWTGGRAFYDPDAPGSRVLARAYLVSEAQFSDIAAQEMYREPGAAPDLDVTAAVRDGRAALGPGRYETLVCPGRLDGRPLLTFTAPWAMDGVPWTRPSAAYVRHLYLGLLGAGDAWPSATVAAYLAASPGAAGHWTARRIMNLAEALPGR
ncbi:histone deacetylase [Streptomyces sp. TRM64462]|uniref:histone deacetylase n=1 Tax=Streptomyces sp. TRM64462 TaxID=2741726 RepID=UPI0028158579|nr:histone deacetylase [Streptomyces sp. TRM64462]